MDNSDVIEINTLNEESDIDYLMSAGVIKFEHLDNNFLLDRNTLVYEQSNEFTLSYQNMSATVKSLLIASEVLLRHINYNVAPFSKEERISGLKIAAPISIVAGLMGYDLNGKDGITKNCYHEIKQACELIRNASFVKESINKSGSRSFEVYGIIDRAIYNMDDNGMIIFFFNGAVSEHLLVNKDEGDYTLYSIMLRNNINKIGRACSTRLHEILKTSLYHAVSSKTGICKVYYDFVELRCKMGYINFNDPSAANVLNDPKYKKYLSDINAAYERKLAIESLDNTTKEKLKEFMSSDEYKSCDIKDKEALEKRRLKVKSYRDRIICQYNSYKEFKKRVISPAQDTFKMCLRDYPELMELMFTATPKNYKGETVGIVFTIYTPEAYKKSVADGEQISIFDDINPQQLTSVSTDYKEALNNTSVSKLGGYESISAISNIKKKGGKRTKEEINATIDQFTTFMLENANKAVGPIDIYKLNPSNIVALAQKYDEKTLEDNYMLMLNTPGVEEGIKWLTSACKGNWAVNSPNKNNRKKKSTDFNNFPQHEYDFKDLEEKLLKQSKD